MGYGDRLRAAIADKNMTIKDFAYIVGYDYGHVLTVIHEREGLTYNFAKNASCVLKVSPAWLLGDSKFVSDEACYKAGYEDGYNARAAKEKNE